MSNMSYCKFRNTLLDLQDCADTLGDINGDLTVLNEEEQRAACKLIRLCRDIADDYGDEA